MGRGGLNNNTIESEIDSQHVMIVSSKEINKNWILDSECTFHMCLIKFWFYNYKENLGRFT